MNARHKLGGGMGWALASLLAACGGDGEAPTDAGTPSDAGRDAASPAEDAGAADAGPRDAGPVDAGPPDSGPVDAGYDAGPKNPEFTVNLTTATEVPACAGAGPAASGTATVALWPSQPVGEWSQINVVVNWQNLSSAVTAAHIHYGVAGASGPVVLPFLTLTPSAQGTFTAMEYQAAQGAPTSFDAFKQEFLAGKAYVNVHTTNCPSGEIRGQIVLP